MWSLSSIFKLSTAKMGFFPGNHIILIQKNTGLCKCPLILFIIADLLQRAVQMVLLKAILGFNSLQYMKEAYVRPILIAMIMSALLLGYSCLNVTNLAMRLGSIVLCFMLSTLVVYYLGLTSSERIKVSCIIKGKILKHGKH